MFKYLTSAISAVTTDNFPYKVDQSSAVAGQHNGFTLYNAVNNKTQEDVSVWIGGVGQGIDTTTNTIQQGSSSDVGNHLTKLKTLRHPSCLRYIDSQVVQNRIHIVTERVQPLHIQETLKNIQTTPTTQSTLALGLSQIIACLSWLNNTANVVHGCIQPNSIYVTRGGDWKLSNFSSCMEKTKLNDSFLYTISTALTPLYACPELQSRTSQSVSALVNGPTHGIDSWSLGCLIYCCFNAGNYTSPAQLTQASSIHPQLLQQYKKLLSTNVNNRLNPSQLVTSPYFLNNPYVQTLDFLSNLPIKSQEEKDQFFSTFSNSFDRFPPSALKYTILPQLTKSLDFGAGLSVFNSILTAILKIGQLTMNGEVTGDDEFGRMEYAQLIVPTITNLYTKPERNIRIHLLTHLNMYAQYLSPDSVNNQIFPAVVQGLTDSTPVLRELTVKSLPYFAAQISVKQYDALLVPKLQRLQQDSEPAIRTNIVYAIAKVAQHLPNAALREKILLPVFMRALRDTFTPARVAALNSVAATVQYYDADPIAKRILPLIVPLLVDPAQAVREASLTLSNTLLTKVKEHSSQMGNDESVGNGAPAVNNTGAAAAAPTTSTSGIPSVLSGFSAYSSTYLGVLGTAVASEVANRVLGGQTPQGSPNAAARPQQQQQQQQPAANNYGSNVSSAVKPSTSSNSFTADFGQPAKPASTTSNNNSGWDADDDWQVDAAPADDDAGDNTHADLIASLSVSKPKPAAASKAASARQPGKKPSLAAAPANDLLDDDFGSTTPTSNGAGNDWNSWETSQPSPAKHTNPSSNRSSNGDMFSDLSVKPASNRSSGSTAAAAASSFKQHAVPKSVAARPAAVKPIVKAMGAAGKKATTADDDWASFLND